MSDLNQALASLKIRPDTSNIIERIDDKTFRQLCAQCGGKGFYIHILADSVTKKPYKTEIVSCEVCEGGFKFGSREA